MFGAASVQYISRTFYLLRNAFISKNEQFHLLKDCWAKSNIKSSKLWSDCDFLVVDLEMSSLDVNTGEILSIGWVIVKGERVQLDSAEHHVIHSNLGVGQSATIHQLRDCEIEQGLSITAISERFLKVAENKVLVFHHAHLDMAFLNKASKAIYGAPLLLLTADTLMLEKNKLIRQKGHIPQGELRLAACRERYNLPLYPAHNALMDAIATSELLIAIATYKGKQTTLKELL
jgi:DNA polymerase-3 subunit epsilon